MKVYAFANEKGGVGKTTTALGIARAFTRAGQRVLVVDLDPQASASQVVAGGEATTPPTITDALMQPRDVRLDDVIRPTAWGFDLAPADAHLVKREQVDAPGREVLLRHALERMEATYDVVIVDCGPSLGPLTLNALNAASDLLVVTEPGYMALRGVAKLLETVEVVREFTNPELELRGIIVNLVDRTRAHADGVDQLGEAFAELVLEPMIPHRTALQDVASRGLPVDLLGARSGAAMLDSVYAQLAKEVTRRGNVVPQ